MIATRTRAIASWASALVLCACSGDGHGMTPDHMLASGMHNDLDAASGARNDGAMVAVSPDDVPPPSGPSCPSPLRPDPSAEQRAACAFGPSTRVEDTLLFMPTEHAQIPLSHVIVMMKENRSYDQLFGKLFEHGQADSEPLLDSFMNPDANGDEVHPVHANTTCLPNAPHQWKGMHNDVHGGKMDGFVTSAGKPNLGHFVMSYYDDRDIPFYYFLANTFAIADHDFPSVQSGTWPNRDYLVLGTSDQVRSTDTGFPSSSLPTLFTLLTARGVSWGVYAEDKPFENALGWPSDHPGVATTSAFFEQLADGTLPQVAFVDSKESVDDEHPPADIQAGEAWTYEVYQSARRSPLWSSMAIVWTYDEAGGFYDHVPPPATCVARPNDNAFFELGIRVPLVVISRWARAHYVSHVQHEHTSILRFIELLYDLPALTARDANSDALLDMFDFNCPNDTIPEPPLPGTGGCR
jgi:phospholipase C